MAERILIVSGGILSLWFGYKLFLASVAEVIKTQVSGAGYSFKAERVGPGIFFAFFGAAVLAYSVITTVSVSTSADGNGHLATDRGGSNGTAFRGVIPVPGNQEVSGDRLKAILTLEQIAKRSAGEDKEKIKAIDNVIEGLKSALVDQLLGAGRYAEWKRYSDMRNVQENELAQQLEAKPDLRRRFYEVENLLLETAN